MIEENEKWQTDPAIIKWCGTIYGLDTGQKSLSFVTKTNVDISLKHLLEKERYYRSYSPYTTKVFSFMTDIS